MSSNSLVQGQSDPGALNPPPAAVPFPLHPAPSPENAAEFDDYLHALLALPPVEPWPEPVDAAQLLTDIQLKITRHVVLPPWAPETLAHFVPHTCCFQCRDVTTYIGIESPEHRCGKSTLITILSELTHRAVVASNVSAPSFFRVIAQIQPTLLIDEADTFLTGNDELRGILNSSYFKKTAFVLRAVNLPAPPSPLAPLPAAPYHPGVLRFNCWCPKVIARIGSLPVTLADRCIVFRLHRKTDDETCDRLRCFHPGDLPRKCLRFALDNAHAIAAAKPPIPPELNDRTADIWEPLLAIADLAGGPWPERARSAATAIAAASSDFNPLPVLLFDIYLQFHLLNADRLFTSDLIQLLNARTDRPWKDLLRGKPVNERWLARQLSPYGIRPLTIRSSGAQAKGYLREDFVQPVRRYVPKSDARALLDELKTPEPPPPAATNPTATL